jgi:hypothetical protein
VTAARPRRRHRLLLTRRQLRRECRHLDLERVRFNRQAEELAGKVIMLCGEIDVATAELATKGAVLEAALLRIAELEESLRDYADLQREIIALRGSLQPPTMPDMVMATPRTGEQEETLQLPVPGVETSIPAASTRPAAARHTANPVQSLADVPTPSTP